MPISDVLVSPRNQNFAVEIKYYSCNTTTWFLPCTKYRRTSRDITRLTL